MPVRFQNFAYSFENKRGKPVFVPSQRGYEVGYELKERVEDAFAIDEMFFHFRQGGHLAALHMHRANRYFARADLHNFFYSISKHRVARALHEIGIAKAGYFAKWSCVKNPYAPPSYALPYGFVQSPLLATLVFGRSPLGAFLRDIRGRATVTVYMDDIAISSDRLDLLQGIFPLLQAKIGEAQFQINANKTIAPCPSMELFNCDLELDRTAVSKDRVAEFYDEPKSDRSIEAFRRYCMSVEEGNRP
jgi:hypothetical protein